MKIYLKWGFYILGPFLVLAGVIYWWMSTRSGGYSREELDETYNESQVRRLQWERAEKARLDKAYREAQRPKG